MVKGKNVLVLRAEGDPEKVEGIYVNEVGIYKGKEHYEQVETDSEPFEDENLGEEEDSLDEMPDY